MSGQVIDLQARRAARQREAASERREIADIAERAERDPDAADVVRALRTFGEELERGYPWRPADPSDLPRLSSRTRERIRRGLHESAVGGGPTQRIQACDRCGRLARCRSVPVAGEMWCADCNPFTPIEPPAAAS